MGVLGSIVTCRCLDLGRDLYCYREWFGGHERLKLWMKMDGYVAVSHVDNYSSHEEGFCLETAGKDRMLLDLFVLALLSLFGVLIVYVDDEEII